MKELDESAKIARTLSYESPESRVVFKIGWHVVTSRPGVVLDDYHESESTSFSGRALFSTKIDNEPLTFRLGVDGAMRTVELAVWARANQIGEPLLNEFVENMQTSLSKYTTLSEEQKQRVLRALLAKMSLDRLIHCILTKSPKNEIYFHLAHSREMIITATAGEEFQPLLLSISAWIQRLEKLASDAPLPAEDATDLAKKALEWKRDTRALISRYI